MCVHFTFLFHVRRNEARCVCMMEIGFCPSGLHPSRCVCRARPPLSHLAVRPTCGAELSSGDTMIPDGCYDTRTCARCFPCCAHPPPISSRYATTKEGGEKDKPGVHVYSRVNLLRCDPLQADTPIPSASGKEKEQYPWCSYFGALSPG